jgi:hypothetical protein
VSCSHVESVCWLFLTHKHFSHHLWHGFRKNHLALPNLKREEKINTFHEAAKVWKTWNTRWNEKQLTWYCKRHTMKSGFSGCVSLCTGVPFLGRSGETPINSPWCCRLLQQWAVASLVADEDQASLVDQELWPMQFQPHGKWVNVVHYDPNPVQKWRADWEVVEM